MDRNALLTEIPARLSLVFKQLGILVTCCVPLVLDLLYLHGVHFDKHCDSFLFDEVLFFTELVLRFIFIYIDSRDKLFTSGQSSLRSI